jgi:hypothetical protein
VFLASYRPLVATAYGRAAIERHGLLPYVDGSCRREPDLESVYPSITALCRAGKFAPRLYEGDLIVYVTKASRFRRDRPPHWRLAAVLHVVRRFESHQAAATWYERRSVPLPRNCVVPSNPPLAFDFTDGVLSPDLRARLNDLGAEKVVRLWDEGYKRRAANYPVFLACEPLFRQLLLPPEIAREDWLSWCGKIPATRTPPRVSENLWQQLANRAGLSD